MLRKLSYDPATPYSAAHARRRHRRAARGNTADSAHATARCCASASVARHAAASAARDAISSADQPDRRSDAGHGPATTLSTRSGAESRPAIRRLLRRDLPGAGRLARGQPDIPKAQDSQVRPASTTAMTGAAIIFAATVAISGVLLLALYRNVRH